MLLARPLQAYHRVRTFLVHLLIFIERINDRNFTEALEVTASAKASFATDTKDLYERGKKLIAESVAAGVTSMRAHVEIDTTVKLECLNIGRSLKSDMEYMCDIMLCGTP